MRRTPFLVLLAALALPPAGCGSKKNTAGPRDPTTTATTTTASAATTAATTGQKLDLSKADSSCKAMVAFGAQVSKAMRSTAGGGTDISSSAAKAAALFAAYAKAAPDDIKSDMQAYAKAFASYAKALSGYHLKPGSRPTAADLAKLTTALRALQDPALQQHAAHLQSWAQTHCGGTGG